MDFTRCPACGMTFDDPDEHSCADAIRHLRTADDRDEPVRPAEPPTSTERLEL